MLQVVDTSRSDKQEEGGSESDSESLVDLDDQFQDELCKLWDMSMNQVKVSMNLCV